MREPTYFYLIFFFKLQQITLLFNFYKNNKFKISSFFFNLSLHSNFKYTDFFRISFYYFNSSFFNLFFFSNFFNKKSFFFFSNFFKKSTTRLRPLFRRFINTSFFKKKKYLRFFNVFTDLRSQVDTLIEHFDPTYNKDLIRVFNRSDSTIFKKRIVQHYLFGANALEFRDDTFDFFAQKKFLEMVDDEFFDYLFHLNRKKIVKLSESLNVYEYALYKKFGIFFYKRYYENVNHLYLQKHKSSFLGNAPFFFNYNFYNYFRKKGKLMIKSTFFFGKTFFNLFNFFSFYLLFFFFKFNKFFISKIEFNFFYTGVVCELLLKGKCFEIVSKKTNLNRVSAKTELWDLTELEFINDLNLSEEELKEKDNEIIKRYSCFFYKLFFYKKDFFSIIFDETDADSIDAFYKDYGFYEQNDYILKDVVLVDNDKENLIKNEEFDDCLNELKIESFREYNLVEQEEDKEISQVNIEKNKIILKKNYERSIFFFFRKFKKYLMLNIILKHKLLNVFFKKNLNNIYIYNFITFLPEDFLFKRLNFDFLFLDTKKFYLTKYTNMCLFQNLLFFEQPAEENELERIKRISSMYKRVFGYNFYLFFFLNLIELKFKKKVYFKVINIYKYFYRFSVYSFYRHTYKRLGYYKFKVRKYFNFLETFKILYMSILFKDATLFMN